MHILRTDHFFHEHARELRVFVLRRNRVQIIVP
uniref:Uncharacterized protein n=1 Tax=Arundo donax TaxID=35708 RepID=A0A0A9AUQ9_ARUDO